MKTTCGRCGEEVSTPPGEFWTATYPTGNLFVGVDQAIHKCASMSRADEAEAMKLIAQRNAQRDGLDQERTDG